MDKLTQEVRLIIVCTAFLIIIAVGIILLVLLYQKKQAQLLKQRQEFKILLEREILKSELEIKEQTMKNIAEEIHDNIGQTLSLVKLNLNTLPNDGIASSEKLNDSIILISKAINDLRSLSKTMNTETMLNAGLVHALKSNLATIQKATGFKTEFNCSGEQQKMKDQKEVIVFRIIQEAINNTIKHAHASLIRLNMNYTDDKLTILISDDGNGFDQESDEVKLHGSGLRNMKKRAELIGGIFEINPTEKGTTINLTIPIAVHEN